MSFDIPSFVPRQVSETLRAMAGRGFQSPLNVALATAIPLIALYSTIPALSSGALSKPKIHPSLETLVVSENSRLSKLKKQASEVYPSDIYGPGHTVELTKGRVKYWLIGPEDGKRVVLIHGLSLPSLIWKHVVARLVKTGFRVLIYDLYGRGYTEAPDVQTTPYNTELYITQLALLMQCVGWRKARIVGLSMGGAIAAAFAAKFPWLVETNVVLIASVGVMESVPAGLLTYIFGSTTIQRLRHSVIGQLLFTPAPSPWIQSTLSATERLSKRLQVIFALQSALLPGYTAAVAASVFLGPLRGLEKEFEKLGKMRHIKVQLIWGAKDEIVPYKYAGKIQKFIPGAELVTIDDAGHDLCVTHSDIVADNLIDFLRR